VIPEPRLNKLYQEVILDHNRRPRNYGSLAGATHHSHGYNPLCGDDYHLYLRVDPQGIVTEVGFEGHGCAISKSSASMLTAAVKGKAVGEIEALKDAFLEVLTRPEVSEAAREKVGRLQLFEGVKEFPIRVKCATLIWRTLEDALRNRDSEVKF
jgi:nitrogen fixation NifU-like protein